MNHGVDSPAPVAAQPLRSVGLDPVQDAPQVQLLDQLIYPLSLSQLCATVGVGPRRVRGWMEMGLLEASKESGRWQFTRPAVERALLLAPLRWPFVRLLGEVAAGGERARRALLMASLGFSVRSWQEPDPQLAPLYQRASDLLARSSQLLGAPAPA